tara:strand:- start:773 stop:1066 length:294 start_codon:yes stop_codon:yes gene_type:complete
MLHETKQVYYNRIKGCIEQINNVTDFPSVTILVGHKKPRHVNILCKPDKIQEIEKNYKTGDEITIMFFVSSRFKHNHWYTNVNCLSIEPKKDAPEQI